MTRRSELAAAVALLLALLPAPGGGTEGDEAVRLNNEGVRLLNAGERDEAIARLRAARRLLPRDETVAKNLAAAYIEGAADCVRRGAIEDAVQWLDAAGAAGSSDPTIGNNLAAGYNDAAAALLRKGRFSEAASLLRTAVSLKPQSDLLRCNLGAALYRDNRRDEALEEFRAVAARDPSNAEARKMCGVILYYKGQTAEALDELREAVRLAPSDADAAGLLAKVEREFSVEKEFAVDRYVNFTVSFDGQKDWRTGTAVLDALEEARGKIGSDLGFYPAERIAVVIYSGRQFSELLDPSKKIGGLYDGKIRVPVGGIDTERDKENLRRVLLHEYAHVAVHFLTHNRCPLWLNEGIAEHLSGGWDRGKELLVRDALERGTPIALARLSDAIRDDSAPRVRLAYAQACSVVGVIVDRAGGYTLRRILDLLDAGDGLDAAFQKSVFLDLEGLEEEWTKTVKERYGIRS